MRIHFIFPNLDSVWQVHWFGPTTSNVCLVTSQRLSYVFSQTLCIKFKADQPYPSQYVDSPDRKSFLADFGPGKKYENTVGIYRENDSAAKIGIFDKALIDGLPSTVRWIAHNGAGYDPVDVHACMAKGRHLSPAKSIIPLACLTHCRDIPFKYSGGRR